MLSAANFNKRFVLSILIVAKNDDLHAEQVSKVLAAEGHAIRILDTRRWPSGVDLSLSVANNQSQVLADGVCQQFASGWCRQIAFRKDTPTDINLEDVAFIRTEGMLFDIGMLAALGVGGQVLRWVNPPLNALAADQKPLQLVTAAACGLAVPRTLISRQPQDIDGFRSQYPDGVVAKPFNVGAWEGASGFKVSYAARIAHDETIADGEFLACPTTYQEAVAHTGDLRIVRLGGEYIAVRMRHDMKGVIDYRSVRHKTKIRYEQVPVTSSLQGKLDLMSNRLGIDFFCADFLEHPDGGEPVFVELNPGGQFLFLDQHVPGLGVLPRFCSLLAHGHTRESALYARHVKAISVE